MVRRGDHARWPDREGHVSALTDARKKVGGLSKPSKMPGYAYSIPAKHCNVGSKLRDIPNSVCSTCYALKGRYVFPIVQLALQRRMDTIGDPAWVANMVIAIIGLEWFRWHDSGDIQSLEHLAKIVEVCRATPTTKHWLPTREKAKVRKFLKGDRFPDNLAVRLSANMIDGRPPVLASVLTSTVSQNAPPVGHCCPAPAQNNKCGKCRACWDKSVENVAYHWH